MNPEQNGKNHKKYIKVSEEKTEFFIELISTPKAIQADVNFVSDEEALQTPDFDPIDK